VELLVKVSKVGKHIQEKFAHKYYDEIGLGIDFTARDLQQQQKKKDFLGKLPKPLIIPHQLAILYPELNLKIQRISKLCLRKMIKWFNPGLLLI
jgi:hypothetical protein